MAKYIAAGLSARVANFQTAEEADVPSLCAVCLGPNKMVKMTKAHKAGTCKHCQRPCTRFQWRVAMDAKVRATNICQACAAQDNACQSCYRDLETGLTLIEKAKMTPDQVAEYVEKKKREIEEAGDDSVLASRAMKRRRFEEKICTFYQKGFCARGKACQFRHVKDTNTELVEEAREKIENTLQEEEEKLVTKSGEEGGEEKKPNEPASTTSD